MYLNLEEPTFVDTVRPVSQMTFTEKVHLARDPSTHPCVLDELERGSNSSSFLVESIADHPRTLPSTLRRILDRGDSQALEFVARNPNTPLDALADLVERYSYLTARDETVRARCEVILWSVAHNTSTPPEILAQLANNRYDAVKERVANNPNTPIEVLLILMVDDSSWISENAERALYARTALY